MKNVNKASTSIKHWAIDDRPMEKLIQLGAGVLSNAELIAILIRSGNKNESALELSKQILKMGNNNLNELCKMGVHDFRKIKGIGMTKSVCIAAALELGRRKETLITDQKKTIRSSADVADYLVAKFKDLSYEIFSVVYLSRANKIIHFEIISKGGISGTIADPRIILKTALNTTASGIILCHNHPSGNLQPSKADLDITKKIIEAALWLDIKVLDHLIVSDQGYLSFVDEGLI
jgi:DNA repair protein RadC